MTGRLKGSKNKCKSHIYTEEHKQFLEEMYKNYDANKLTNMFNKKFNLKKTKIAISASLKRYGFKTDRTGQYIKGDIPLNKGKTWDEYMPKKSQKKARKTTFKKGSIPANLKTVGSERLGKDEYILIKIEEKGKWVHKHRHIYEQHHGPIKPNHIIIFLDQDKYNFDINNLKMISKSELLILNQRKLIKDDPGLTTSGILVAKLIDKTNKLMRSEINEK